MKSALPAILLFVATAGPLWLPFDSYVLLYGTRPNDAVPAGEIGPDFRLVQEINPATAEPAPDSTARQHCFAIRFATYARHNEGSLRVYWRQDRHEQQWLVSAGELADNSYRHFCPADPFSAYRPFHVEIHGVDGKPGKSATLWLVADTSFGSAQLFPAKHPQGKSLALQGLTRQHITPSEIVRIDRGAWLIGWLCTLVIGVIALIAGFRNARNADTPDPIADP